MPLPSHLEAIRQRVEGYARDFGLDFYDVVFECVTFEQMNMIAAFGGFPTRYPHWKFGMEYEQLAKSYTYGLSRIYELVINNDPSYAYLMSSNEDVDQKLVMAHVYGHVDFFKNNFSFAHTNRKMMDTMANHGTKVRRYMDKYGVEKVEGFIDKCLSVDNLIDRHSPFIKRRDDIKKDKPERDIEIVDVPKIRTNREYMQKYINPEDFIAEQKRRLKEERDRERRFPDRPERDIILFLLEYAPLENWERDILAMVREEAYYFAPQAQTKILNEGWASFWHTTIMTQKALTDAEVIDYADHHAGTMGVQPGSINPYKLGLELLRDIEDRWNRGRFGKEWEECDSLTQRKEWNNHSGLGRQKLFEVRSHYNDVTFIDEFLTEDFIREHKLFNYGYNRNSGNWEITDRDAVAIRNKLLTQLTNMGQPFVYVIDGNHENRGELLLKHQHEGTDLRNDYMRDTLSNIYGVWTRPVNLITCIDARNVIVRYNGQDFIETEYKKQF
ncbi:MAG: SpoVR family protein [Deltaproteobacteria bacterium]|nr:SpoVR family protein [Deltaproteobacteria bacterium]